MRASFLILLLAAGCTVEPARDNLASADINAAAEAAQGDIDTYAANSLQGAPTRASTPTIQPAPPVAQRAADEAAEGPAQVVTRYYALIAARRFDRAWALWDDGGRASGMSAAQFRDSFARYADYRAEVGTPGRVEAGAGQRYVEVPVRVSGTLADRGRPFAQGGTLTLHRTGNIDGATAEQRSWRISASSLRATSAGPVASPTPESVDAKPVRNPPPR